MLRTDVEKLRWMGVDMRSRGRRRTAVVLTYAAYVMAVWVHPWRTEELMLLMLTAMYAQTVLELTKEVASTTTRRVVLGALCVADAWFLWRHHAPPRPMAADTLAFLLIVVWSVLGWGKLVDIAWRENWFTRRFSGRATRLESLDEFARHFFGESFAELTEEQQVEVGRLHRANPMGEWVKPGSGRFPTVEDERLRHEDDRLRAQVQRWMSWILVVSAMLWSIAAGLKGSVGMMAAWAWTVAALAVTLRQAMVLWTEPGVGDASGEMELVQREA